MFRVLILVCFATVARCAEQNPAQACLKNLGTCLQKEVHPDASAAMQGHENCWTEAGCKVPPMPQIPQSVWKCVFAEMTHCMNTTVHLPAHAMGHDNHSAPHCDHVQTQHAHVAFNFTKMCPGGKFQTWQTCMHKQMDRTNEFCSHEIHCFEAQTDPCKAELSQMEMKKCHCGGTIDLHKCFAELAAHTPRPIPAGQGQGHDGQHGEFAHHHNGFQMMMCMNPCRGHHCEAAQQQHQAQPKN